MANSCSSAGHWLAKSSCVSLHEPEIVANICSSAVGGWGVSSCVSSSARDCGDYLFPGGHWLSISVYLFTSPRFWRIFVPRRSLIGDVFLCDSSQVRDWSAVGASRRINLRDRSVLGALGGMFQVYRVKDNVTYSVIVEEYDAERGGWRPYTADDLQVGDWWTSKSSVCRNPALKYTIG